MDKTIQKILDDCLLPRGILSHAIRRVEVDKRSDGGKIDKNKYVVYRQVTSGGRIYGNGKRLINRVTYDINLYYDKSLTAATLADAHAIIREIEAAFMAAGWYIINGQNELYDNDIVQNGINIEVANLES